MNSTAEDIKDMLETDSSVGLTFATDLFVGHEPSEPDNAVTIYDSQGQPTDLSLDKNVYHYSSAQVRIRNRDYRQGYALAKLIMDSLHGREHETWNGTVYTLIRVAGDPAFLRWDENRRVVFVLNVNLQRR